nr:hypothetical protein [Tanacetum cinerariifolium]
WWWFHVGGEVVVVRCGGCRGGDGVRGCDDGRGGDEWCGDGGSAVGSGRCHGSGWPTVGVAGKRGCGVEAVALVDRGVVVASVAVGLWMVGRRVGASDIVDRVDRVIRILFGFAEKSKPKKFSSGGVVAGGGGGWEMERVN